MLYQARLCRLKQGRTPHAHDGSHMTRLQCRPLLPGPASSACSVYVICSKQASKALPACDKSVGPR